MYVDVTDSETYRGALEAEIRRHASRPVELVIVEDIAGWAASRKGNAKGNPPAISVVDGTTGQWGIVLRRSIDADWIGSILSRVELGGFPQTRAVLNTPEIFLRHLVLHELAHLENGWGQEDEENCDAWAFERL